MNRVEGATHAQPVSTERPEEVRRDATADTNAPEASSIFQTKLFELGWAGVHIAARLNRQAPPTPPTQSPDLTSSGSGTETRYRIGNPTRPPIRHDNGFLQNPNDRKDPRPIPTVPPTQDDRDFYDSERNKVKWAKRAIAAGIDKLPFTPHRLDLHDGIDAYQHFLEGDGRDRTFSYEKFVKEDKAGRTILNNATNDMQKGVEDLYNQMIARDPSLRGKAITFNVTGGAISAGSSNRFPYADTENWQKALGGHAIWTSATVTVHPPATPGGRPEFSMRMTLHAEDRYNFNPDQHDIATGAPDALRGRLETVGLAHQYMNYATLERDVRWTQGNIGESTTSKAPGRR